MANGPNIFQMLLVQKFAFTYYYCEIVSFWQLRSPTLTRTGFYLWTSVGDFFSLDHEILLLAMPLSRQHFKAALLTE